MNQPKQPVRAEKQSEPTRRQRRTSRLAWAGLILGLLALICGAIVFVGFFILHVTSPSGIHPVFMIGPLSLPLGGLGIIVSVVALVRIWQKPEFTGTLPTVTGIVLAVAGIVLMILVAAKMRENARRFMEARQNTRWEENAPRTSTAPPVWSIGETDNQSLAEPFVTPQFKIRPPSEFRFVKHLVETNTYYWIGPVRDDDTYAQLFVIVTQIPEQKMYDSLDAGLEDVLAAVRQRRTDWSNTPSEHGRINGHLFARSSWQGIATSAARKGLAGRKMHGIVYLTLHDGRLIQIMCQDVAPGHMDTLERGKLAALTFRAATAPSP